MTTTLSANLKRLGLTYTAETLNDLIARATQKRWPLRANIAETIFLAEFSEQGEKKDQRET